MARAYITNSLNQYTDITNASIEPVYDNDGNLTYDGVVWSYMWDAEDRMIEARGYSVSPSDGRSDPIVRNTLFGTRVRF